MMQLKLETPIHSTPSEHYREAAHDAVYAVIARAWLIIAIMAALMAAAAAYVWASGPRYTAEAMIRFTFTQDRPAAGADSRPLAVLDASSVVESAANIMRSRSIASAVVRQLDPDAKIPVSPPWWSAWLGRFGANASPRSPQLAHDIAVANLMDRIKIKNNMRSYLISIAVTDADPDRAALLANTFASQYLREQAILQVTEELGMLRRRDAELSTVYGPKHPALAEVRTKLVWQSQQLESLRSAEGRLSAARSVAGHMLMPAEKVNVPDRSRLVILLILAACLGLVLGSALALALARRRVR